MKELMTLFFTLNCSPDYYPMQVKVEAKTLEFCDAVCAAEKNLQEVKAKVEKDKKCMEAVEKIKSYLASDKK